MNASCINIPTQTEPEQEVACKSCSGIIHDDTSGSECVVFLTLMASEMDASVRQK